MKSLSYSSNNVAFCRRFVNIMCPTGGSWDLGITVALRYKQIAQKYKTTFTDSTEFSLSDYVLFFLPHRSCIGNLILNAPGAFFRALNLKLYAHLLFYLINFGPFL